MKSTIRIWLPRLLVVLGGLAASPLLAQQAASVSLGEAGHYNLLVFGDFQAINSSTTGPVAAQGNITLNHHGLATDLAPDGGDIAALAGGELSFDVGKVYGGHLLVGQNAHMGPEVRYGLKEEQWLLEQVDIPIDFDRLQTQLVAQSRSLSQMEPNGTAELRYGGFYLSGDCTSELQIFHLDGAQLLAAHTFEVDCIPDDANIVINISGEEAGMRYMSLESLRPHRERTLYNFYDANRLSFQSIAVQGSVLAPNARVENPTGDLYGTLVARSWNGPMFLNHVRFRGYREGATECEGPADT